MKTNAAVLRCRQAIQRAGVLLASFGLLAGIIAAQEKAPVTETPADSRVDRAPGNEPQPRSENDSSTASKPNPEKLIKVTLLLAAIGGIAISGVGVIAATMLWARHLRRLARDMGPPQKTAGNDFWFLKPPKPIATESEISDSHRPPHTPPETETPE